MVQYSPLDPQKSEIRLVTLLPGKPRDAIRCTLSTASLDSAPEFTALSYAWGDPSITKHITVDSEPFDVTVNLELCLRTIRKRWGRRVLWIDAICINQQDIQEKNVQVPQMRRLYFTAPAVLSWLGPSNPNIKLFVSWMQTYAAKNYNTASAHWLALNARSALSKRAKRERDWILVRASEGYFDFVALSYWSRVWTFQEYILPRIEPICVCGDIQPFQLSTVIGEPDIDALTDLKSQALDRLIDEVGKMNEVETAMLVEAVDRGEKKANSATSSQVWALPRLRTGYARSLGELLSLTWDRRCFDERDKIFALHGLVPAVQDVLPPDYTKPTAEVMFQAATYIVNVEHNSHELWPWFGLRDERLEDHAGLYPSWMPDFSLHVYSGSKNLHVDSGTKVAMPLRGPEDSSRRVLVEHTTLLLRARCLGTCKVVVPFADTRSEVLEQINGLLQMNVLEDDLGKTARKPETFISRLTRLCFAHHLGLPKYSTKEILETFLFVFVSGPDPLRREAESMFWSRMLDAAESLTAKALFVTEDGCFGISVGGAREGDLIVIPPGVEVPLVLTPESSIAADGVQYYKMVGTAIVDGVMKKGELFDEELVEQIVKRDVVEYLVH